MLRKIAKEDLNRIYTLGCQYDNKFKDKYNLEAYLNNDIYLMHLEEKCGIIVGFIIGTIMTKNVEILLLYVDEEYRNHKIGTKLLKSVEENAKEVLLEVSKENKIALHLYQKSGYEIIATREKYYNGIDALVMKKVLK